MFPFLAAFFDFFCLCSALPVIFFIARHSKIAVVRIKTKNKTPRKYPHVNVLFLRIKSRLLTKKWEKRSYRLLHLLSNVLVAYCQWIARIATRQCSTNEYNCNVLTAKQRSNEKKEGLLLSRLTCRGFITYGIYGGRLCPFRAETVGKDHSSSPLFFSITQPIKLFVLLPWKTIITFRKNFD